MTAEQLQKLMTAIQDRFGYVAGQIQSVDYQPEPDLLERWKNLGLVSQDITPATFMASVPAAMHFVRNAFMMGRFIEAVEAGKPYHEIMQMAVSSPLLAPDLAAIAVAEQQTAMYLTDNAADLATKVGQIAIQKRTETIRQMAVDYHGRKLKRTVLDEESKREAGIEIPERYVDNWREFSTELHQVLEDKARDNDRVAFFEIENSRMIGQAHKLLEDHGPDVLVYKRTMPSACPQCLYAYNVPGTTTPKVFKLSELLINSGNIGKKPHPVRGGKVVPGGRADGAETMKPIVGLHHPWCQCQLFQYTGYEPWAAKKS